MYPDYVIERAAINFDEDQIDKIFPKEYVNRYIIILILSLVTALFFGLNILINEKIVVTEEKKGHPSPLIFFFLQVVFSILLSLIVYYAEKKVIIKVKHLEKNPLKWAFLLYIIINILWCTVLFHSVISAGLSGVLAVIMMVSALWLCVCAFNYDRWTVIPSIFFLLWNVYLLYFTYDSSVNIYRGRY